MTDLTREQIKQAVDEAQRALDSSWYDRIRELGDMALRTLDAEDREQAAHENWSHEVEHLGERAEKAEARIRELEGDNARLRDLIDRACNALTDSVCVSGNDRQTNLHWVRKLEREALATPPPDSEPNQCDGCRRGLPLGDGGVHIDSNGNPVMFCTADRYDSEPAGVPDAVRQVIDELRKAREKFPQWPDDPIHAAAVVQEEAGELVQATLQSVYEPDKADYSHAQREAIQLGAMAVRFIENMGAYRTPPRHQHDDRALAQSEQGREWKAVGYAAIGDDGDVKGLWVLRDFDHAEAFAGSCGCSLAPVFFGPQGNALAAAPQPQEGDHD